MLLVLIWVLLDSSGLVITTRSSAPICSVHTVLALSGRIPGSSELALTYLLHHALLPSNVSDSCTNQLAKASMVSGPGCSKQPMLHRSRFAVAQGHQPLHLQANTTGCQQRHVCKEPIIGHAQPLARTDSTNISQYGKSRHDIARVICALQ